LVKFDERATVENLRCELASLALHWDKLKTSALEEYTFRVDKEIIMQAKKGKKSDDMDMEVFTKSCSACKTWSICC
jgi:hypothetical protein